MRFHDPVWLYLAPMTPLVGFVAWWGWRRGGKLLSPFVSPAAALRLSDPARDRRRAWRTLALALALAALTVALARPQYGVKPVEITRSGIDVMILVDTSKSMAATDVTPDRFRRVKIEIEKLAAALEGNRIGLVSFAGESFIDCPLTHDVATLRMFLDAVKIGSIPVAGTDIGGAVLKGVAGLAASDAKSKALVLFTDGEDLAGEAADAAEAAAKAGVKIFTVGVGSREGAPAPEVDEAGKAVGYKENENGEVVITRLDEESLKGLAAATGGAAYLSDGSRVAVDDLAADLARLEKTDIGGREFTEYEERYRAAALLALLLLAVDYAFFSGFRRSGAFPART